MHDPVEIATQRAFRRLRFLHAAIPQPFLIFCDGFANDGALAALFFALLGERVDAVRNLADKLLGLARRRLEVNFRQFANGDCHRRGTPIATGQAMDHLPNRRS